MKKIILITVILSATILSKLNAQNIKNDIEFYKSTSYLLSSLHTIDEVMKSNNKVADLAKALPILEKNNAKIQNSFTILQMKYPKDSDFKVYENWVLFSKNVSKMIKENNEALPLGLYLINDDINGFLNSKY